MTIHRQHRFRGLVPVVAALVALGSISSARAEPPFAPGDTVVVVVSAANSMTTISRLHLANLYMGRTTRFPNGQAAVPINQKTGSAVRAAFSALYLGRSETQMKAHWSRIIFTGRGRPPTEASTDEAARDMVAADPNAIGYVESRLVSSRLRIVRVQ